MQLPFFFKFKWYFKQIVQSKGVIIGFYIVCLLPFILTILAAKRKSCRFEKLSEQVSRMGLHIEEFLDRQKDRNGFFERYKNVDRRYLDRVMETATFLKPEVDLLKTVCEHPAFESCDSVKKRLSFLTNGENALAFVEGHLRHKNCINEIDIKQKHPIEINHEDLKHLLSLIEGVTIGDYHPLSLPPQLFFRRFILRRNGDAKKETFLLEMELMKREVVE